MFKHTPTDPDDLIKLQDGSKTTITRRKRARFRLLILALSAITKATVNNANRKTFHTIAWALGEAGEVEACEAIMKEAEEKPVNPWYYGVYF
jgi:hypothetical protein